MEIQEQNLDLSGSNNSSNIITLESLLGEQLEAPIENTETPIEALETVETPIIEIDVPTNTPSPEKVETQITVDSILETSESDKYKSLITKMVEMGEWEEFDTIEDADGNELNISEIDVDEDTFKQIVRYQSELKSEKLLQNKVEIEGISDFTKKLIEIEKSGGDVRTALNLYEQVQDPLSRLDLNTTNGQAEAIYMLNKSKGLDDETIETLIAGYAQKGILKDKAEESKELLDKAVQAQLDNIQKSAEDAKIKYKENLKSYRNQLKESLTKEFKLNDSSLKKILDAATKPDDNNTFELDAIYNSKRKNAAEAHELAMFLLNKEEYLKQKFNEEMSREKLSTFKKLKLTKKEGSSMSFSTQKERALDSDIDLAELTK
jgi:hypothetical protein